MGRKTHVEHMFHRSYLVIIKGLTPKVVSSLFHDLSDKEPPAWMLDGRNWITIFMVILVPLAFLRQLNSLRHTSYIALFSVGESSYKINNGIVLDPSSLTSVSSPHCDQVLLLAFE